MVGGVIMRGWVEGLGGGLLMSGYGGGAGGGLHMSGYDGGGKGGGVGISYYGWEIKAKF